MPDRYDCAGSLVKVVLQVMVVGSGCSFLALLS
jgi:hypothetical protein